MEDAAGFCKGFVRGSRGRGWGGAAGIGDRDAHSLQVGDDEAQVFMEGRLRLP